MQDIGSDNLTRIYPDRTPLRNGPDFNPQKLLLAVAKSLLADQIASRVTDDWRKKLLVRITVYSALTAAEVILENRRSIMQNFQTAYRNRKGIKADDS